MSDVSNETKSVDKIKRELLQAAHYPGNKDKFCALLSELPDDPREIIDDQGQNLLHFAGDRDWKDVVETLIVKYDFDPHFVDEWGGTVLGDVCARGHAKLADYLMREWRMDPLKRDNNGKCPLDFCTNAGHTDTIRTIEAILDEAKANGFKDNPVEYLKEQKAQQVFERAMQSGSGQLKQSNITMHGPAGAGKSSVKRLVAGMDPLPKDQQNATDIMEPAIRAMTTTKLQEFKVVENSKYLSILANQIMDQQSSKGENETQKDVSTQDEEGNGNRSNDDPNQTTEQPIKTTGKIIGPSEPQAEDMTIEGEMKALDKLMNALKIAKPSSNMFESRWFHLIDSGGQPQFLDILPLIYSCVSLHIVVMRLTDGLDKRCPVRFYCKGEDEMQKCHLPTELCMTNHDMIKLACQIATNAAGHTAEDSDVSRVIIIGTHVDELDSNERDSILTSINDGLAEERENFGNVLIPKSQNETVFALNAVAEGNERQKYVRELQTCISKNTESAKPIKIPPKWLAFQVALSDTNEEGITRLSECHKIAEKVNIGRDEVPEVLKFLSSVALIHYFPDCLPNLVFTKMEVLISKVSNLVKASFAPPNFTPHGPSERLRKTGIFDLKYLRRILGNMENDTLTEKDFLRLLCHLKIIARVKGKTNEYFLPSALSLVPCSETPCETSPSEVPLSVPSVFNWRDRYLPHGFFFNVIMELLSGQCLLPFELRRGIEYQCREEIQLCVAGGEVPGVIKLRNRCSWIQLSYSDDPKYCPQMYKAVKEAIERSVERFKEHTGLTMPDNKRLLLCSICTVQDHYCFISDKLSCSKDRLKTRRVESESMLCWWQDEDCKDNTVQVDGKGDDGDKGTLDLNLVDNEPLLEKDLVDVLPAVKLVNDWFDLGLGLGFHRKELKAIEKDYPFLDDQRREMIGEWLRTKDSSWRQLISALSSDLVKEKQLAKRIAIDHPAN